MAFWSFGHRETGAEREQKENTEWRTTQVGGTLWDAYNTVTYWADHERGRRAGAAVDSSLFGDSRNLKAEALQLAVDYAGRVGAA